MKFPVHNRLVSYSIQENKFGMARICFRWDGRQERVPLPVKKKRQATKAMITEALDDWKAALVHRPIQRPGGAAKPYKALMEEHFTIDHDGNKPSTIITARIILEALGKVLGYPDVRDITKSRFREVIPQLKADIAAKTWANRLGEIGHFARWLAAEDHIPGDFTVGVKRPARSQFGTHDEIYLEEWYAPIRTELADWAKEQWEDRWFTAMDNTDLYEFQPRKHMIEAGGSWKIWKIRAKEGKRIDLPISSHIRSRWVRRYQECGPDDFLYPDHRCAHADSWGNRFRLELYRVQKALSLPHRDAKCVRHTFVTRHLQRLLRGEKNAPSFDQMRRWLGHDEHSREVERVYAKLASQVHLMD